MFLNGANADAGKSGTHWAPLAYSDAAQIVATINGTEGSDALEGTLGDDAIFAFGGFDTIIGSSGIDYVDGGESYDSLAFLQYHGALAAIGGPRTFVVGADFVRDDIGSIDTTFAGIEAIELAFLDLPGDLLSDPYVFDLAAFIGDGSMGRTRVSVNEVRVNYTGSSLDDSLASEGGNVTADGGEGFDDFLYIYSAGFGSLEAHTDDQGRIVVRTDGNGGAILTSFEAIAIQGGAHSGGALSADFADFNMRIDWLSSASMLQTGDVSVTGTAFDDTFQFGWGADTFTGGGGYNTYGAYTLWDDVGQSGALFDGDVITDFSVLDAIDLSYALYGSTPAAFIGSEPFTGKAGEVRYEKRAGRTLLMSDGDGDGLTDATLTLTNGAFDLVEEAPGILVLDGDIETWRPAVVSDFDGGGTTDILFRAASGDLAYWLIDGIAIAGRGSISVAAAEHVVATGDFVGDGRAEPLLRTRSGSIATGQGIIGDPGARYTPVAAGDLDGDGKADIVFRNAVDGSYAAWLLEGTMVRDSNEIGNPGSHHAFVSLADFDGDGCDDMLFRDANGTYAIWRMDGTSVVGGGAIGNPGTSWFFAGTGDFDGDGRDDILFRNIDGSVGTWQLDDTRIAGGGVIANPGDWVIAGTGDYNGDGKSDILFRDASGTLAAWHIDGTAIIGGGIVGDPGREHGLALEPGHPGFTTLVFAAEDGTVATWLVSGTEIVAGGTLGNPGPFWTAIATGDLTGMGATSVLFRGADGRLAAWQSDGTGMLAGGGAIGQPGSEWSFRALADFNGDSRDDILFQNDDGSYFVWNLADSHIVGGGALGEAAGFDFIAAGDLDGDGRADLLLRDQTNGEYAARFVSRTGISGSGAIGSAPGFSFAGLGDFNGDGTDDILLRNESLGTFTSWNMDGTEIVGGGGIGGPLGSYELALVKDVNRDGRDDLIFQDASGQHMAWTLADTQVIASGTIGPGLADWGLI
jgi:hypothetical protein